MRKPRHKVLKQLAQRLTLGGQVLEITLLLFHTLGHVKEFVSYGIPLKNFHQGDDAVLSAF